MKVTLAQINTTVGDIAGNLLKIEKAVKKASDENSDLIVFPELCVTGYPPQDLLTHSYFMEEVSRASLKIEALSNLYPEIGLLIGMPLANKDKKPTNSAVLFYRGKPVFTQHKSLLPQYDVFDDSRFFEKGKSVDSFLFKEERLGVVICEDAWGGTQQSKAFYSTSPVDTLFAQSASIIIVMMASPFESGKEAVRYELFRDHAKKAQAPLIAVNQVGGQDELIFDGQSLVFNKNGDLTCQLGNFKEDVKTIDLSMSTSIDFEKPSSIENIYDALVLGIKDYAQKCGFSKVVLGLSGGIDSAVTCCLAVDALGASNVLGVTMPSEYSSKGSIEDSESLAKNLGITLENISIAPIVDPMLSQLSPLFKDSPVDFAEENIQARIRGTLLMALSNKFGHLLLSTGNKSELSVGYCTLYGDMNGGLCVLGDVYKGTVYALASHINRHQVMIPKATITKAPSAELRPDQKDQDTLPPYDILDSILEKHIEKGLSIQEISDTGLDPAIVTWVINKVRKSEYKRRQAAPSIKLTAKAFGMGRRMPIASQLTSS